MIERTEGRFGLKPKRLAADTAYGSAARLDWIVNTKQIEPHIPVWDRSKREDGTFSREDLLRGDQANIVPEWLNLAGDVMRARAGF
jgi:hypothetical protein